MDLDDLLRAMPFEPGRLQACVSNARDGREVLLVRLELGILQLELDGRPDGGASVLDRLPGAAEATMEEGLAAALRLELVQYQQRAMALAAVGRPSEAIEDCDRALGGAGQLAADGGSRANWAGGFAFSILVTRTRIVATSALSEGRTRDAAAAIEAGLSRLRDLADRLDLGESFEALGDVAALRAWRDALVPRLPPAQRSELEARLRAAVAAENFELAAILRDELRLL